MRFARASREVRQADTDFLLVEVGLDVLSNSGSLRAVEQDIQNDRGPIPVVFRATKIDGFFESYVWSGLGEPAKTKAQLLAFEPHTDNFAWESD